MNLFPEVLTKPVETGGLVVVVVVVVGVVVVVVLVVVVVVPPGRHWLYQSLRYWQEAPETQAGVHEHQYFTRLRVSLTLFTSVTYAPTLPVQRHCCKGGSDGQCQSN